MIETTSLCDGEEEMPVSVTSGSGSEIQALDNPAGSCRTIGRLHRFRKDLQHMAKQSGKANPNGCPETSASPAHPQSGCFARGRNRVRMEQKPISGDRSSATRNE